MKVAITGSSKGIGLEFAKEFLRHSDEVVISSRTSSAIDRVVKEIKEEMPKANIFGSICDVTKLRILKN